MDRHMAGADPTIGARFRSLVIAEGCKTSGDCRMVLIQRLMLMIRLNHGLNLERIIHTPRAASVFLPGSTDRFIPFSPLLRLPWKEEGGSARMPRKDGFLVCEFPLARSQLEFRPRLRLASDGRNSPPTDQSGSGRGAKPMRRFVGRLLGTRLLNLTPH